MNVFMLDTSPDACAQAHIDTHVVKMPLEGLQLLCSAHWQTGGEAPYRSTHAGHPWSVWTRASLDNYRWLLEHVMALLSEYTHRYERQSKMDDVLLWCIEHEPAIPPIGLTPMPLCFGPGDHGRHAPIEQAVAEYRRYYRETKSQLARVTWTRRDVPEWWNQEAVA